MGAKRTSMMKTVSSASYIGVDQRTSPRTDVYARLAASLPGGRSTMATLVNISADGLLIRHDQGLAPGDIVYLSMPVIGRVAAITIWSIGGRSGLNFCQTIREIDYVPLLRALCGRPA